MEAKVLWIYSAVKDRRGLPVESGQRPAFCFRGRKYMLCVIDGYPVRVVKRDVRDFDQMRVVELASRRGKLDGSVYPIELAIQAYEHFGRNNGITEGAKKLLSIAREQQTEVDEDQLQDEEDLMRIETPQAEDTTSVTATATDETVPVAPVAKPKSVKQLKKQFIPTEETTTMTAKKSAKKTAKKPVKKSAKKTTPAAKKTAVAVDKFGAREGTKKSQCLAMIEAGYMKLKPAERKDPPHGFKAELSRSCVKKVGWGPTTSAMEYIAMYEKWAAKQ